ncbi:AraC family transcriptional regulator [Sphingosinicella sp. BN140058]|nr:AraC family transcriptional regulator [Sphingosinicella sp. BN140058]
MAKRSAATPATVPQSRPTYACDCVPRRLCQYDGRGHRVATAGREATGPAPARADAALAPTRRFATRELPEHRRDELIREFYGRIGIGVDIAPIEVPLDLDISTLILPKIMMIAATTTPLRWDRRPDLTADGNDDICITWAAGGYAFRQHGRSDVDIAPGAACVIPVDRPWSAATLDGSWKTNIQIERRLLLERVPDLEDVAPDCIERRSPEAALLFDYQWWIARRPITEAMAPRIAEHIADLLALALGASADARQAAREGGVRAARLLALQRHIAANLHRPMLCARSAAKALGISERYVRSLLSDEETTFSDYVADRRLDAIRSRLLQPSQAVLPIADIAAEFGFFEPSTFYRRFKARFGMSPSEFRRG